MTIASIRLQNFRSYSDDSFEFEPGVNIVVGPNASGKTNLLEAVLVLARGSSYRVKDPELIKYEQPWARLDGVFREQTRTVKLELKNAKVDKSFEIDDKPYKRLSLERNVPVVFFEPNHLQFITRGPDQRRDYLDELLERSVPGFKTLLANYRRVLAQRNALLKQPRMQATKQIFAWNIRLSELGTKIAEARAQIVQDINKNIAKNYSQISQRQSKVEIFYDAQFAVQNYASKLLHKLENNLEDDFNRGFTAYGPHREDIIFYLDGQPANLTASRGESRSLVLALKIFELELVKETYQQSPIFLLDDVFSELDGKRRHALVDYLKDHQVIITTTEADAIIDHFTEGSNILPMSYSTK